MTGRAKGRRSNDETNPGSIGTCGNHRIAIAMQPKFASGWQNADGAFIAAAPDMAQIIRELSAERDRLRAENEALRADAERYRWLRAFDDDAGHLPRTVTLEDRSPVVHVHLCNGDDLDAAIDAARSQP